MELHQLNYVLALAKYQHFSRAADEICVSQSTLSQQINKLENELGVLLFARTTRTVQLTSAGKEFIRYAARIISEVHQSKNAMLEYISADRGEIIIGAIPIIGYLGLTSVIAGFQKSHPAVHIEIKEDASDLLLASLLNFEIDVALMSPPSDPKAYPNVSFTTLLNDDLVLIVPQGHLLATKKMIHLKDAKNEKFIMMKTGFGMLRTTINACKEAGFEPSITYQSSQVETILSLVAEGLGVSLLTSRLASSMKNPTVRVVKLRNAPKRITALAVVENACSSPSVKAFCKYTRDRFNLS